MFSQQNIWWKNPENVNKFMGKGWFFAEINSYGKNQKTNRCVYCGEKMLVMFLAVHVLIKKKFLRPKRQHDF